ncbi:tetratricopeptide repeat protein [Xanthobacter sediminis]
MAKGQRAAFGRAAGAGTITLKSAQDARRAAELHQAGMFAEAMDLYTRALKHDPKNPHIRLMLALCLGRLGRLPEAIAAARAAAKSLPNDADVASSLGGLLAEAGETAEAEAAFARALALKPDHSKARAGIARLAWASGDIDTLRQMVIEHPDDGEAALLLGSAMIAAGNERDAAIREWMAATQRGALTRDRIIDEAARAKLDSRSQEALGLFQVAAILDPSEASAHCNIGALLLDMRLHRDAANALKRALEIDPQHVSTLLNFGALYFNEREYAQALPYYRRVLTLNPDEPAARFGAINNSRQICQWERTEEEEAELATMMALDKTVRLDPFVLLSCHVTPADHLRAARTFAKDRQVALKDRLPPAPPADSGRRIRIGYLSADFHTHATAFLAVEMFERHDRETFEVFAYSYGPDDGTAMRRRVVNAFDHFVEIGKMSDRDAANRIRDDGIDILVDLKGYTKGGRAEILARRPSPVQVNFLGYPGTMGADFVDYIIGDPIVTPLEAAANYDEKIVQLPDVYQPNDAQRIIADTALSRAACDLPEGAFVFCCFNNTYKITPAVFEVWMHLLDQVPGSVLWLFEANAAARDNLAYEAASRGIEPERLIFAPLLLSEDHMARYVHADLFLDTRPYNAHTTASDALWAGVPLVTCPGESFASRVAASLLHAVGLSELVAPSLAEYEALALALARDPARLAALKAHLLAVRTSAPLFDAARYTHGIEAAYRRMHALRCAGLAPEPIVV